MKIARNVVYDKYSKYKKCLIMAMLKYIKQQLAFEAKLMKKLSNTKDEL